MELGHWECSFDFDPANWFGFVYRIIDNTNGMHYIGKKQFMSVNRKSVINQKRKKVIRKASNWTKYTGSSDYLNNAIKEKGKENFTFIIESLHETKGSLFYAEIETQIFEDVLRAKFEDGTRRFYNRTIGNIKFTPPDETSAETRAKSKHHTRHRESSSCKSKRGENNPRFGKSPFEYFTEERLAEHKKKLSKKMTGANNPMFAKRCDSKMSEAEKQQWRDNISKSHRGRPKSEITKERMRKPKKIPQPRVTCDVCGMTGGRSNMLRYHFENCKRMVVVDHEKN